jgi:hypothetical protein
MKCTYAGVGLADQMYEGTDSSLMFTVPALLCLN